MLYTTARLVCAVVATFILVEAQSAINHDKRMVCYYDSWAYYRPEAGHFDIPDIDPTLCTHGVYAYAAISNITWKVYAYDEFLDLGPLDNCNPPDKCVRDGYRKFVQLKSENPDFVPMLSIGGWNNGPAIWSDMAKDPAKRDTFADSLIEFASTYGFEGFDIDWEYPTVGSGSDEDIDKEDFSLLLEDLRAKFDSSPYNLTLSAALAPVATVADTSYDISRIFAQVDYATILTYQYHGYYTTHHYTGHPSPLARRKEEGPGTAGYQLNVYDSINYYLTNGAPREKMNMGIAPYGNGYILADETDNTLYCDAVGPIPSGPWIETPGLWGYTEIQLAQHAGTNLTEYLPGATPGQWTIIEDYCYSAKYMRNGPYWIGYEDFDSIAYKAQYANYANLGGATMWTISLDDFLGLYSSGVKYPLLKRINLDFENGINYNPYIEDCIGPEPMCYYSP